MKQPESLYESLLKDFSSPIDFISTYIVVYDNMSKYPCKVFHNDVPYFENFDINLLDHLFKYISKHTEEPESLENYFILVEKTILEAKSKKFYDVDFYESCTLVYIKSLVFLIDQSEFKILNYGFDDDNHKFLRYLKLLLMFSSAKIDLNELFVSRVRLYFDDVVGLTHNLQNIKSLMDNINLMVQKIDFFSSFVDDPRYISRLNICENIVGEKRIEEYSFFNFLDKLLDTMISDFSYMPQNEQYLKIINFLSEIELKGLGNVQFCQKARDLASNLIK